jgi:hypothetical protein
MTISHSIGLNHGKSFIIFHRFYINWRKSSVLKFIK